MTDKQIQTYYTWERAVSPNPTPIDSVHLDVVTRDGWLYRFKRFGTGAAFEFLKKFRPDRTTSEDDTVPESVISELNSEGFSFVSIITR